MKRKLFSALISFVLIWVALTAPVLARQVVTEDVKSWAKQAVEQEQALEGISAPPNSVAILYFFNKTDWSNLDLLQKGLAIMLMTDLSKVEEIQLIERVKLQALVDELDLGVSGLVEPDNRSRLGKLLGAEHLIGGDILKSKIEEFQLKANLLKVPTEKVFGQPMVDGKLLAELFRMEKDLLFEIIEELKIELSPELEAELRKPGCSLQALLYFFEGIEKSDVEDYEKAAEFYEKALQEDPDCYLVQEALQELLDLGLIEVEEAYSPPEGMGKPELRAGDRQDIVGEDGTDQRRPTIEEEVEPTPCEWAPGEFKEEGSWSSDDYDYWTGYKYGLQTVGQDGYESAPKLFTNQETLDRINGDCFLAYAVQVEEDRLNEQIIERAHRANTIKARVAVYKAQGYGDIRARDAALTEMADAQSGRVLRDRNGKRVRVQQYVLRHNDSEGRTSVQLLNVCLRGEADLSTMDFTTKFTEDYTGDLRNLPWNEWLDTQKNQYGEIVLFKYVRTTAEAPELDNMYVKFTNPASESLQESRVFDAKAVLDIEPDTFSQLITSDQLTLTSQVGSETYNYAGSSPGDNEYAIVLNPVANDGNPDGFRYMINPGGEGVYQYINVAFYVVGDAHRADNQDVIGGYDGEGFGFKDIWDALRVNEQGAPNIGNNNLEIAITDAEKNFFSKPIDVVYIPMSRMLWKDKL